MMLLALVMFFSVAVCVQGKTKCYDIGCVTNDPPYKSSPFPQSPESINTRFLILNNNTDSYQVISTRNLSRYLQESHYDCRKKSVFIIHGYLERGNDTWLTDMCKTILQHEDVNCLCVDWSGGAWGDRSQATSNVQVVGAEIAYFIKKIMENYQCSPCDIHLIGHCFGAHVAGEAGKRHRGIGKIIGLDAIRPGFEGESHEVSLDRSDANFVVAIHTGAGPEGPGVATTYGHKDFYPNGGEHMPGCPKSKISDWNNHEHLIENRDKYACNHVTGHYMFTASICNPDGFMGYCASNYQSFQEDTEFPCTSGRCSPMGYYTEPGDKSSCNIYYLNTGPRYNYERWRFLVAIEIKGPIGSSVQIILTVYNSAGFNHTHNITRPNGPSKDEGTYSAIIDNSFPPPITGVSFKWYSKGGGRAPVWGESVTLTYGITRDEYKFCGSKPKKNRSVEKLNPCK